MAIRKMTLVRWQKELETALENGDAAEVDALQGSSPGAVAASLRISRQAVHEAIHRGNLDAIVLTGGHRPRQRPLAILIPSASVAAYRRVRAERKRA